MRAGELNRRVTLQNPVLTRNANGERVTTYVDVAAVWAAVEWGSGRRYEEAAKLNSQVAGIVRIRHRTDVQVTWRVKYGDRYFEILSISNFRERNEELRLNCREWQD